MKQFILQKMPDRAGGIRLEDRDYHYLVHVRRLKPGSTFRALLPDLRPVTVRVRSIKGHTLEGEVGTDWQRGKENPGEARQSGEKSPEEGARQLEAGPPKTGTRQSGGEFPSIYLFQALPRGTKMDLIVRQAAEGGIAEIVPFMAEHSIPKKSQGREERWRRIIKEARQQSGSPIDTRLRSPLSGDELLAYWRELQNRDPAVLGLILHETPVSGEKTAAPEGTGFMPLEQGNLHYYLNTDPSLTVLVIGPEGGFSGAELKRFINAGFKPLWMGNTILRTETAALYGAAAVRIILLEKPWWMMKQKPERE
ncbi:MAG: 16S rRNA (uracil(1498)-N(3))-methyltransferase [Spirochaetaceae bacterium]|jgi:16S rRNA (uracil1498-N3)-methyltransferase|nr:16S rRNA (uracil(1498)-N(3))-methyltransferase [Spirochaetaceae bacterium]